MSKDESVLATRYENQKKVLQRMTLSLMDGGSERGLSSKEVQALREALLVLGWVPADVKLTPKEGA